MSSTNSRTTNSPKLTDPEAASAMFDAVRTVAEQSFFAVAEPADDRSFGVADARGPRWLVATVGFDQGTLAGSVTCTLPEKLANGLFDAFTGRDPGEAAPVATLVHDLVGEFSNMVCGAWRAICGSSRRSTTCRWLSTCASTRRGAPTELRRPDRTTDQSWEPPSARR